MRVFSAIGLVTGVTMMTAPFWLPQMGIGIGFGGPSPQGSQSGSQSGGGARVDDSLAELVAAMERAASRHGVNDPDTDPGMVQPSSTGQQTAAAAICDAMRQAGQADAAACEGHLHAPPTAAPPTAAPAADVPRKMGKDRNGTGAARGTARHPGAKFVKVGQ